MWPAKKASSCVMSQAWVASWLRMPFELPSKIQRAPNESCKRCNGLSFNTRGQRKSHRPLRPQHSLAQLLHEPDRISESLCVVPYNRATTAGFELLDFNPCGSAITKIRRPAGRER